MKSEERTPPKDNRVAFYLVAALAIVGLLVLGLVGLMKSGLSRYTELFEGDEHRSLKLALFSGALLTAIGGSVNLYHSVRSRLQQRGDNDPEP